MLAGLLRYYCLAFAKILNCPCGSNNITLRGNVVRDIISHGTGYGVSAYYFDEGSHDCLVEGNISISVPRPTHNHICHDIIMRDNVFIHDGDMTLSFQRSSNHIFTGNKLITGGELIINQPNALDVWEDNVIVRAVSNCSIIERLGSTLGETKYIFIESAYSRYLASVVL